MHIADLGVLDMTTALMHTLGTFQRGVPGNGLTRRRSHPPRRQPCPTLSTPRTRSPSNLSPRVKARVTMADPYQPQPATNIPPEPDEAEPKPESKPKPDKASHTTE